MNTTWSKVVNFVCRWWALIFITYAVLLLVLKAAGYYGPK